MSSLVGRKWAVALAAAVLVVVAAVSGIARSAPADASEPLTVQDAPVLQQVPVPVEVRAALQSARRVSGPVGQAPDAAHGPAQVETITLERFEGDTFPPEGWVVNDALVETGDPQWTWGPETCQVQTGAGGQKAAWSVGGGAQGSSLGCWTPYSQPVRSTMLYSGIDASNYAGGVRISFVFRADWPDRESFRACWVTAPDQERADCYYWNVSAEQMNRWLTVNEQVLEDTGAEPFVGVFFLYEDQEPDGSRRGAIVDNVLIEGLTEEVTEEPTAEPPTPRPSRTPVPTAKPRTGFDIYLPLIAKRISMEDLPTPVPGPAFYVVAEMGIEDENGTFQPGTVFPAGTMGLCMHVKWEGVPIGTQIRWQWYAGGEPIAPDNTQLNQTIAVEEETGQSERTCIQYSNQETGERFPLPEATYGVEVWVDRVGENDPVYTSASVIIGEEPPTERTLLVDLGTVDDNRVFTPGTRYQEGLMSLCVRTRWWLQPIGTEVRWQWFIDEEPAAPDNTQLNPAFQVESESGQASVCLIMRDDETQEQVPLMEGTYRVDVWVDQVAEDDPVFASAEAVIGAEGTPAPITPTPVPTREPGTFRCNELMVNGNFEQGSDVGWAVQSNVLLTDNEGNQVPLGPEHFIFSNDDFETDPAHEGQWLAFMGNLPIFREQPDFDMQQYLFQTTGVPLVDATRIISAELKFFGGLVTEEQPDGSPDDVFAAIVVDQADQMTVIPRSGISEENVNAGRWFEFTIDVTEQMTAGSGTTAARFGFGAEVDTDAVSQLLLDQVRLTVCETIGAATAARRPAATRGAVMIRPAGQPVMLGQFGGRLQVHPLRDALADESPLLRWSGAELFR